MNTEEMIFNLIKIKKEYEEVSRSLMKGTLSHQETKEQIKTLEECIKLLNYNYKESKDFYVGTNPEKYNLTKSKYIQTPEYITIRIKKDEV